jgi:hypothetical protein
LGLHRMGQAQTSELDEQNEQEFTHGPITGNSVTIGLAKSICARSSFLCW